MSARFSGKVAIITGATSGIGEATARRLTAEDACLVLAGRSVERGEALAAELGAVFIADDLVAPGAADRLTQAALQHYGCLGVLVNNAALDHTGDLLTTPIAEAKALFDVNFFAALRMIQAAGQVMGAGGGGAIVNVTSRLASVGVPSMSLYGASKGALQALTRGAAVELAPLDIRVNAVAPGITRTPLYDTWLSGQPDSRSVEAEVVAAIPQRRLATPDDIASAIAYLASDEASHVTGITLPVDGGYTAVLPAWPQYG